MAVSEVVPRWWIFWYFGWTIATLVSLTFLLLTITLGRAQRPCIINSLLLITNNLAPGPAPPFNLCVAQASLLMPSVAAQAVAVLGLTTQIIRVALEVLRREPAKWKVGKRAMLAVTAIEVGAPWAVWVILALINLEWGLQHRERVVRAPFYCSLNNNALSIANTLAATIPSIISIGIITSIAILLITSKRHYSRRRLFAAASDVEFSLVLRILPFGIWLVIGVAVGIAYAKEFDAPITDMVLIMDGASVFLLLLQEDILLRWGIPPSWIPFASSGSTVSGVGIHHAADDSDWRSPTQSLNDTAFRDTFMERTESNTSRSHIIPISYAQTSSEVTEGGRRGVERVYLPDRRGPHPDLLAHPEAVSISRPMARRSLPPSPIRSITSSTTNNSTFAGVWPQPPEDPDLPLRHTMRDALLPSGKSKDRGSGEDGWKGGRPWNKLVQAREERRIQRVVERRSARDRPFLDVA
ncbi:hypothetical protein P7C70_g1950, partial [Phenoliferia sp. Uapishka_3]